MALQLYDKCRLKDGREGWIIEILGGGDAYLMELDKKGIEDRIVDVTKDEILEKVT